MITQPALFVHSMALFELVRQHGLKPDMIAGHSLGEFSAFTAAGALDFAAGLQLVKTRGELMQDAGKEQAGAMAAILGLEYAVLQQVCTEAQIQGVVAIANFNSPTQLVISGSTLGVQEAMRLATARGARRAIPLPVSGAFHSPLMEPARAAFAKTLANVNFNQPQVPVYCNVTALPCGQAAEIADLLEKQLVSPVLWTTQIEQMIQDGATRFIEIGSGSILSGLIRKINPEVQVSSISSEQDIVSLT
jgi:[acyl-carrier-protein] S-malonyltransferase